MFPAQLQFIPGAGPVTHRERRSWKVLTYSHISILKLRY
jgi:hypothetical protein